MPPVSAGRPMCRGKEYPGVTAKTARRTKTDSSKKQTAIARRLRVAVCNLELGLFVSELDRPWIDTPFLLQGFLLDSNADLENLRNCCKYVYVDLKLSDEEVAAKLSATVAPELERVELARDAYGDERVVKDEHALPTSSEAVPMQSGFAQESGDEQDEDSATTLVGPTAIEPRPKRQTRSAQARNDPPVSDETRQRFLELVRAIAIDEQKDGRAYLDRISNWLSGLLNRDKDSQDPRTTTKVNRELDMSSILPEGASLTVYKISTPIEVELPRAKQAFIRSKNVARDLARSIEAADLPDIPAVRDCVNNIVDSMIANPDAVMLIARLRDEDLNTYFHGVKVSLYLIALGRHLGIPKAQLAELGLIGMLADVGKIKVPRTLLAKPGALSPAEFEIVKEHVGLGLAWLEGSGGLTSAVMQGIAQHHERLDGSGYPKGLTGDQLGVYGRMTAIADSFTAMITPRPYSNASSAQEALLNLYEWGGTLFSAPMIEQFVQAIGVFPVGSLVELSNGEVAAVVAHNRVRRLEPKVLVLTRPDKSPLATPIERDLFELGKSSHNRLRITKGVRMNSFNLSIRDYYLLNDTVIDESGDGPDRQDASS
jgi:HD-GYP domain-containing protein (c-di-GMP phosphodiesterase class II)